MGHLGTRAIASAQPGLVNLGDRGGRGRFRLQLRENLRRGMPIPSPDGKQALADPGQLLGDELFGAIDHCDGNDEVFLCRLWHGLC